MPQYQHQPQRNKETKFHLSSLSCTELVINNTKLDQAATSSLVGALQHGVEGLQLDGRLHIQTLLEYDGRGRCGQLWCYYDPEDTYQEEMKALAENVNWGVTEYLSCDKGEIEYIVVVVVNKSEELSSCMLK